MKRVIGICFVVICSLFLIGCTSNTFEHEFIPDSCIASTGISCLGKPQITDTTFAVSVGSGLGKDIAIAPDNISTTLFCSRKRICPLGNQSTTPILDSGCVEGNTPLTLRDGQGVTFSFSLCSFLSSNDRVIGDIFVEYIDSKEQQVNNFAISVNNAK